ncbi:uncharacterized protein [Procambarus clarkii]|uniref:uncharacterized protein isoform X2 n=2 Tax=Procambarus clarkii TaxID=6728 RepID=UPI00374405FF
MGCKGSYASEFLRYLEDFVANIRPDDPLPVRAPNYKVTESEIDGQILDIVHHYLSSRQCPPYVREYVGHRVWTEIRNPGFNGDDFDEIDAANTTNHTYDTMKLIQEVTSKANTVIQEMHSNLTIAEVEKLPRYNPISHFAIKNGRRKMEDRHVLIHDLNTLYGMNYEQPHAYYGVFDGHAGIDAAVYTAAHLHQYMIQNPQYETNPEAALKHAFHITDTNFVKKASKEKLKGGTTAVVALVREKRLVVAWLGDSQALLVRRRHPVRMVEPHKPELPVERERVEEMGGCVINIQGTWRVLGQLAVSRAIGDREYKPYVSSECDIKSLEIEGDEDFLILACDGLWDTLSPEAAVNVVYAYLTHNDGDTDGVGRCLVEAARNKGSEDNITAVVVFLRPVVTLMEEEAQRVSQGQVPEPVPAAVLCKDSTPSSINAIFSPPINQFDYSSPTNLTYNPFEGQSPLGDSYMEQRMETEEAVAPLSLGLKPGEPLEGREAPGEATGDADSQEAAGAQGAAFSHHEAPTPTAEEVDAALAELDSIPDGVCESGDVEEEEDDEEGWSYFHMEPQTRPQSEDVLVHGSSAAVVQSSKNITETFDQDIVNASSEDHLQLTEGELVDSVEQSTELFPELKDQSEDQFGNFVREQAQETPKDFTIDYPENEMNSQLMDSFQFQPKEQSSPMEADQPPVVANAADFLQTSIEKPFDFDISSDKATLMETSLDKIPDVVGSNVEPSSPHGSISPHVPGSPRSVEGYITSVELNTAEESFGQNFAINQSQDLLIGAVDQPSGAFSVYVSSSPEPASLDPSLQTPIDLGNVLEGVTNGTLEGDFKVPEPDLSPVEIVHAQSTVEVVAPPSPVDIKEQEVQFIVPNPVSESPTSPQLFSDLGQSSDITFIPEPVVEPVAEVPVPVYIEGNTPVSEGEMEMHPDSLAEEPNVEEMGSEEEEIPEIAETVCEPDTQFSTSQALDSSEPSKDQVEPEADVIKSPVEPEADVDIKSPVEPEADVDIKSPVEPEADVDIKSPVEPEADVEIKSPVEPEADVEIKSPVEPEADVEIKSPVEPEAVVEIKSPVEPEAVVEIKSPVEPEAVVEIKSPVEPEVDVAIKLPTLSVENEAKSQPDSETVNVDVNGTPADIGVGSVINDIVEDVLPAVEEKKLEMPKVDAAVTKASIKTDKTPVKGTPSKTSAKPTPGKVTPAKPTSKSTPTRTPSTKASPLTKTAERKSPVTKTLAAVPGKPAIEKSSSTKLAPTKPAQTKPATAKPTTTTTAARPSSTKPIQRTATPRLSTTSSLSTKTERKITPKPPTPTAPRASLSKPSASASKPAPARPTPTTRTITKRPVTAPSKSTDKPDSSKEADGTIRKTTTRPTSAPRTTTTTTTSASRKVMPASARSAAEKETKNTTNRILSTSAAKPAPRPTPGMTKPPLSKTSTTAARSTLATNTRTTTKVNGTSTTSKAKTTTMVKSSATKSSGVATKRTMVSKTKTTTTGEKVVSEKTDKAEVIGAIQPVVNGENKIADEETSVEVIDKCAVEDIMQASTEKVFTQSSLTMTTSEQVVTTTDTTEVIVNGDH